MTNNLYIQHIRMIRCSFVLFANLEAINLTILVHIGKLKFPEMNYFSRSGITSN